MYTGSLPPASIHGTWVENIEIWSIDDNTLMDLSGVTQVTLRLRDPATKFDDMILTLSEGSISVPSNGIIQWRAEVSAMGALTPQLYEVILTVEDGTDTVPLVLGSISIVE